MYTTEQRSTTPVRDENTVSYLLYSAIKLISDTLVVKRIRKPNNL